MLSDEWEKIAVQLAKNCSPASISALRGAFYAGAGIAVAIVQASLRANDHQQALDLFAEMRQQTTEKGQFE